MIHCIKIGGASGVQLTPILDDIAAMVAAGEQVVVIHGCSQATEELARDLAEPIRYVTSVSGVRSRYTDARMIRIFSMAAQQVNQELTRLLVQRGIRAVGLNGLDGSLLRGPRKETLRIRENGRTLVLRDDFTGTVEQVNTGLLHVLMNQAYVPVIAPLALSYRGEILNVDGDRVGAAIAAALGAETLLLFSNVSGVYADYQDTTSLIATVAVRGISEEDRERPDIRTYSDIESSLTGGMRRKLIGAREAIQGGVSRVIISDGNTAHPIQAALSGRGTTIR